MTRAVTHLTILLLLMLGLGLSVKENSGQECVNFIRESEKLYSILALSNVQEYTMNGVSLSIGGSIKSNGQLIWNYCKVVDPPKDCPINLKASGFFFAQGECYALTSYAEKGKETDWSIRYVGGDKTVAVGGEDGIEYLAKNGETNSIDKMFPSNVRYVIKCDPTVSTASGQQYSQGVNNELVIIIRSKYGCGQDPLGPISKILEYKEVLCGLGIFIGFFLVFFGYRVFKPGLCLLVFAITAVLTFTFFEIAWSSLPDQFLYLAVIVTSTIMGAFASFFVFKYQKIAYLVGGIFLGLEVGLIVYSTSGMFKYGKGENVILIAFCCFTSFIGSVVCYFLHKYFLIIGTAFGGSYLLIKSIGTLLKNFPNEWLLAAESQDQGSIVIPKIFYIYLGIIGVIGLIGTIFQYWYRARKNKEKEEEELDDDTSDYFLTNNKDKKGNNYGSEGFR